MKTTILLLFLAAGMQLGAQNLILNPSFDQNDLNINCSYWENSCGEPLSSNCTETGSCMVHFEQDSPSMIPENRWCVALTAGFPNGNVLYHLTGLEGTLSLRADAWIKSNTNVECMGIMSIGITENGIFTESKNASHLTDGWQQMTMYDTIQLTATDSLTLILSSTMGDFIFEEVLFDEIGLEIVENLGIAEAVREQFKVAYDPGSDLLTIENKEAGPFKVSLLDLHGREIKNAGFLNVHTVSMSALRDGLYFLQLETDRGTGFSEKIVKY
ncbi:MAG: T9SS type A sorting domain-containing protein [Bacteroidota bacterium]